MAEQQVFPNQIKNTTIQTANAAFTIDDTYNNLYLRKTGTTAYTLTLTNTVSVGFSCVIVNRAASGVITLSATSQSLYKNGGATAATSAQIAAGGKVTLFVEAAGVWTADGSGLS